jgi:SAM-dependent methyltransferase
MEGYEDGTYGDRVADIYDETFSANTSATDMVRFLDDLAGGRPARILELAVGTGRVAIPLARLGHDVTGIDVSDAMLQRLRQADTEGRVEVVRGDMVDDVPAGPFDLVYVAFNTIFMLADPARQAACFKAVAAVLTPAGSFVVEGFVPYDPPRHGSHIDVSSMSADRVVLDVSLTDAVQQLVTGQRVLLVDGEPVRLLPYVLRWSHPHELDAWAAAAGIPLAIRYADVHRTPFDDDSGFHLSVYRR